MFSLVSVSVSTLNHSYQNNPCSTSNKYCFLKASSTTKNLIPIHSKHEHVDDLLMFGVLQTDSDKRTTNQSHYRLSFHTLYASLHV